MARVRCADARSNRPASGSARPASRSQWPHLSPSTGQTVDSTLSHPSPLLFQHAAIPPCHSPSLALSLISGSRCSQPSAASACYVRAFFFFFLFLVLRATHAPVSSSREPHTLPTSGRICNCSSLRSALSSAQLLLIFQPASEIFELVGMAIWRARWLSEGFELKLSAMTMEAVPYKGAQPMCWLAARGGRGSLALMDSFGSSVVHFGRPSPDITDLTSITAPRSTWSQMRAATHAANTSTCAITSSASALPRTRSDLPGSKPISNSLISTLRRCRERNSSSCARAIWALRPRDSNRTQPNSTKSS